MLVLPRNTERQYGTFTANCNVLKRYFIISAESATVEVIIVNVAVNVSTDRVLADGYLHLVFNT